MKWSFGFLRSRLPEVIYADLFGPLPFYWSPLVTGSKVVRADRPGEGSAGPPLVSAVDICENFVLHGGAKFEPASSSSSSAASSSMASSPTRAPPPLARSASNASTVAPLSARVEARASAAKAKAEAKAKAKAEAKAAQLAARAAAKADKRDAAAAKRDAKADKRASEQAISARMKGLGSVERLRAQTFDPALVYTFEYYDSYFRADSFTGTVNGGLLQFRSAVFAKLHRVHNNAIGVRAIDRRGCFPACDLRVPTPADCPVLCDAHCCMLLPPVCFLPYASTCLHPLLCVPRVCLPL